jgi:hypothetical protein
MVRELSTSRAFGPSGVKGDELAAVEFVPFDELLSLDHFADVAVDGRRAIRVAGPTSSGFSATVTPDAG